MLLHYHQNLFSITSLTEVLRRSRFGNIRARLFEDCSYRGQKSRIILASASLNGARRTMEVGSYVADAFCFPKVVVRMAYRELRKILDRLKASILTFVRSEKDIGYFRY